MKLALILGLYAAELLAAHILMRAGLEDIAVRALLAICALFLPIVVYSWVDCRLIQARVTHLGREWCEDRNVEFVRSVEYKKHFSITYKTQGKNQRQKLRIHLAPLSWKIKEVVWL